MSESKAPYFSRNQTTSARIILLMGNVGTGKSTHARTYESAVICCLDSIVESIEGKYVHRKEHRPIYHAVEDTTIETALKQNIDVVIDRTCMSRFKRKRFVLMAKQFQTTIECIDFGPGNDKSLEQRISDGNRGYTPEKWREIHLMMMMKYEKPSLNEGFNIIENKEEL